MDCPRCGAVAGDGPECLRCGVVLAKARRPATTPALDPPPEEEPDEPAGPRRWTRRLGVLALTLLAVVALVRGWSSDDGSGRGRDPSRPATADDDAPSVSTELPPASIDDGRFASALEPEDLAAANAVTARLRGGEPIREEDVHTTDRLYSRYGDVTRGLHYGTLLVAGHQRREAHRYDEAERWLERAAAIADQYEWEGVQREMLALRLEQADWSRTEALARDLLERKPNDPDGVKALAYTLVRQNRSREAREILEGYLGCQAHPCRSTSDPDAAKLLARLVQGSYEDELTEARQSHFTVSYSGGDTHQDVAREVLLALERHFATLSTAFRHQPADSIPVLLLPDVAYYGAAGNPTWSAGNYDQFDGKIRVPIGGLTNDLGDRQQEMETLLLHELTHAFVADLSAGLAPREVQEGLAQWMTGLRSAEAPPPGSEVEVAYFDALAFVEYLIAERSREAVNELLLEMGRTRSVDEAFVSLYERDFRSALAAARTRRSQR